MFAVELLGGVETFYCGLVMRKREKGTEKYRQSIH